MNQKRWIDCSITNEMTTDDEGWAGQIATDDFAQRKMIESLKEVHPGRLSIVNLQKLVASILSIRT